MFRRKEKQTLQTRKSPASRQPAAVFSYYASRSPGEFERASGRPEVPVRRATTGMWTALPTAIALLVIAGSFIYATTLGTMPKVQIDTSGDTSLLRSNQFYVKGGAQLLDGSILNRNKLTINTAQVASQLEARYPELGNVSIIIPLVGHRPLINVHPAKPVIILRGDSGNYVIDEQGRALLHEEEVVSSVRDTLPVVTDQSSLEISEGKAALPLVTVQFIQDLTSQLAAKHLQIHTMALPAIANELHLQTIGDSYYVKFDIQGDVRQQTGAYLAARDKLSAEKNLPQEYMDVRVADKVFYK